MIDISEQRTLLMFLQTLEIYCNKQLCAIHACFLVVMFESYTSVQQSCYAMYICVGTPRIFIIAKLLIRNPDLHQC